MLKEEQKSKALGSRGKTAEKAVKDYLEDVSRRVANFDWGRIYDARSARGKFPSRTGDYEFYFDGRFGLIEVKEVDHLYRLPAKNFDHRQIARLRKRQMAGGLIAVLVYHTPHKQWRSPPLSFFIENLSAPSWDLRGFEPHACLEDTVLGQLLP